MTADGPSCRDQGGLRLGELRVHDDRVLTGDGAGDERERLGATCGREHALRAHAVPGGHGQDRGSRVRIATEVAQRVRDDVGEPGRRCGQPDVDSQVDETRGDVAVTVVVEVDAHDACLREADDTAYACTASAKRAAS